MADHDPTKVVDIAKLTKPFDRASIKSRVLPGGGSKRADYVEGHTFIHRLNDATGNNWSFLVDDMHNQPAPPTANGLTQVLWICRGTLTIPGLGTRAGVGVQMVNEKSEDLVKGALTDCLKACAKNFGVGIELYGPDYEDDGEQVDRRTGEITAPSRPAASPPAEAAPKRSPRDEAAVTLADFAKSKGVTREMLQVLAVEKIDKTLERCDLADLLKLLNFLKAEKDMDQLKDFLRSDPPPIGQQSPLMARPEPTPLRSAPDRYTQ